MNRFERATGRLIMYHPTTRRSTALAAVLVLALFAVPQNHRVQANDPTGETVVLAFLINANDLSGFPHPSSNGALGIVLDGPGAGGADNIFLVGTYDGLDVSSPW